VKACLLGGILVAGESARIELQLKNHSAKRVSPSFHVRHLLFLRHVCLCG
jgi:hypothetical protein